MRGPDNTYLERIDNNIILGFNRLRINDITEVGD